MKIEKIETEGGTVKYQECGIDAQILFETDDGTTTVRMCMNCYLNVHDRDRIQWYRRIWTMKSMMEQEKRKGKPRPPKWGIRGLEK